MRSVPALACIAALSGGCLKGPAAGGPPPAPKPPTDALPAAPALPALKVEPTRLVLVVAIQDFLYKPAKLAIERGTTVRFVNEDVSAHTATSDNAGGWGTPLLKKGESAEVTFEVAGEQPYHCEPHPWMTAAIDVK